MGRILWFRINLTPDDICCLALFLFLLLPTYFQTENPDPQAASMVLSLKFDPCKLSFDMFFSNSSNHHYLHILCCTNKSLKESFQNAKHPSFTPKDAALHHHILCPTIILHSIGDQSVLSSLINQHKMLLNARSNVQLFSLFPTLNNRFCF